MDITQRIAQFENMVQADPANDMAHFSLGGAYNQAGRFLEAAESFMRCIQLNAAMSKAYQMAGAAFMAAGQTSRAADVLTDGYKAAAERGDRMPMKAMGDLLKQLGQPVPEVAEALAGKPPVALGSFVCQRTGRPGTKMARPPFKGPVGQWIGENISKETFEDWIRQGTKVINELRLDLSREQDSATYDQHMREFLGIDEELYGRLKGSGER
jgi:Fe-S cluster biosynthesis and repair protein YggX